MRELTMWPGMDRTPFQIMEVEDFNTPIGATGAKHNYVGDGTESIVVPGSFRIATGTTTNNQSVFHTWPVAGLDTDTCHMRAVGAFTFGGTTPAYTERNFFFGFGTTAALDADVLSDAPSGGGVCEATDDQNFFGIAMSETAAEAWIVGQLGLDVSNIKRTTYQPPASGRVTYTVDLKIKNGVVDLACAWSAPGTNEQRWFYPYGLVSPQPPIVMKGLTMDGAYTLSTFFALGVNGTDGQTVDCDFLAFGKTRL